MKFKKLLSCNLIFSAYSLNIFNGNISTWVMRELWAAFQPKNAFWKLSQLNWSWNRYGICLKRTHVNHSYQFCHSTWLPRLVQHCQRYFTTFLKKKHSSAFTEITLWVCFAELLLIYHLLYYYNVRNKILRKYLKSKILGEVR